AAFQITSSGNLGLSTSTPGALLSVAGSAYLGAGSASTLTAHVSTVNYPIVATSTILNNTQFAWTIATSTTASPLFRIDTTSANEQVTIGASSADVYIGDVGLPSNIVFQENSSIKGADVGRTLTVGSGGDIVNFGVKVGIGTTSPFAKLQIASSSLNSTSNFGQLVLSDPGAGSNLKHWLFTSEAGDFHLGTTADSYATTSPGITILNANGYVVIGTSTPGTLLSVGNGINSS